MRLRAGASRFLTGLAAARTPGRSGRARAAAARARADAAPCQVCCSPARSCHEAPELVTWRVGAETSVGPVRARGRLPGELDREQQCLADAPRFPNPAVPPGGNGLAARRLRAKLRACAAISPPAPSPSSSRTSRPPPGSCTSSARRGTRRRWPSTGGSCARQSQLTAASRWTPKATRSSSPSRPPQGLPLRRRLRWSDSRRARFAYGWDCTQASRRQRARGTWDWMFTAERASRRSRTASRSSFRRRRPHSSIRSRSAISGSTGSRTSRVPFASTSWAVASSRPCAHPAALSCRAADEVPRPRTGALRRGLARV